MKKYILRKTKLPTPEIVAEDGIIAALFLKKVVLNKGRNLFQCFSTFSLLLKVMEYQININEGYNIQDSVEVRAIREALENPKYGWRSLLGVAKQAELDLETVQTVLHELEMKGEVVKTMRKDGTGIVYTTRKHYEDTHNFLQLSLSAITNNIIY